MRGVLYHSITIDSNERRLEVFEALLGDNWTRGGPAGIVRRHETPVPKELPE